MVALYLGMTELTIGINTDRKLTLLSRSLADLTSRSTSMDLSGADAIFSAATAVMQPYDATNVSMTVTSVVVQQQPSGTPIGQVAWSCKRGPSPVLHAIGSSYTVPKGFEASDSFLLVETALDYVPMFGGSFMGRKGVLPLGQTTPWPVRDGSRVSWAGTPPSSC
jgi:hypothetical protein